MDLCGLKPQVRRHIPGPSVRIPWTAVDPGKRVGQPPEQKAAHSNPAGGTLSSSGNARGVVAQLNRSCQAVPVTARSVAAQDLRRYPAAERA
ncbi:MAG: hypothetical protein QOJ56_2936 [Mycobacterium sp.]|jgi:hypothetical protein|nr:hypothetical protein [Mycobacterium sp.]